MRRFVVCLAVLALLFLAVPHASLAQASNNCADGFALRNAYHGDPVCIPYAERRQVADDNALNMTRIVRPGSTICKNGFQWRMARPGDTVCTTAAEAALIQQQNRLASSRLRANNGVDFSHVPESQRPGAHTLELRVSHAHSVYAQYTHKGYVFIGLLNHGNLDCEHGIRPAALSSGSGASLVIAAGYGVVMGNGHPDGGGDRCVAWITQAALDFDMSPYTSLPGGKQLNQAILSYHEREAPACIVMNYTQGGFAVDSLRCYTDSSGRPASKPQGCVTLKLPSENWMTHPPSGVLHLASETQYPRMGTSAWNVTDIVNYRIDPVTRPWGFNATTLGNGFLLVGTPLYVSKLENARENTRCASMLEDIKLTLRYTILPPRTGPVPILK